MKLEFKRLYETIIKEVETADPISKPKLKKHTAISKDKVNSLKNEKNYQKEANFTNKSVIRVIKE